MILYNWKKVKEKAINNSFSILDIIFYITYKPKPLNKFDISYKLSQINWIGTSFLINPEKIFENRINYTTKELIQYIALASLRNYADYKATNEISLWRLKTSISDKTLNSNRLLTLDKKDRIHFLLEEVT